MESDDFEILNNKNKMIKIHTISLCSDNNKIYNIYLNNNIISKTNK